MWGDWNEQDIAQFGRQDWSAGGQGPSGGAGHPEAVDERPVDLHRIDREALEIAQRRIARAKVIDGQRDSHGLETRQCPRKVVDVLHEDALGQLEAEALGGRSRTPQDILDQKPLNCVPAFMVAAFCAW